MTPEQTIASNRLAAHGFKLSVGGVQGNALNPIKEHPVYQIYGLLSNGVYYLLREEVGDLEAIMNTWESQVLGPYADLNFYFARARALAKEELSRWGFNLSIDAGSMFDPRLSVVISHDNGTMFAGDDLLKVMELWRQWTRERS